MKFLIYSILLILIIFNYIACDEVNINVDNVNSNTNNDENINRFNEWLVECGASFDGLYIKDDGIRGVYTDHDINVNEKVMVIPRKCIITVEMGKRTDIGQIFIQSNHDIFGSEEQVFLTLYILSHLNNEDNYYKPYFDTLPKKLTMPIFWTKEELEYLNGSFIKEMSKTFFDPDYQTICKLSSDFCQKISPKIWQWGRMIVISRIFQVSMNNKPETILVPYADMLNHIYPQETTWDWNDSLDSFTVTSLLTIPKGHEVHDSYGWKSNDMLLTGYGFSLEQNKETDGSSPNEVFIKLNLNTNDPLYLQKKDYWDSSPLRVPLLDNELSREFFARLRFRFANSDEVELISGNFFGKQKQKNTILTIRNEILVLDAIQKICLKLLSRYPTTLQQDIERLNSPNGPEKYSNERNALIQVKGEKFILTKLIDLAKKGLKILNNIHSLNSFRNEIKNIDKNEHHFIEYYIVEVIGTHYNKIYDEIENTAEDNNIDKKKKKYIVMQKN